MPMAVQLLKQRSGHNFSYLHTEDRENEQKM